MSPSRKKPFDLSDADFRIENTLSHVYDYFKCETCTLMLYYHVSQFYNFFSSATTLWVKAYKITLKKSRCKISDKLANSVFPKWFVVQNNISELTY